MFTKLPITPGTCFVIVIVPLPVSTISNHCRSDFTTITEFLTSFGTMPPKFSAKKEPAILWFECERCLVNITSKDREQHEQHCPIIAWKCPDQPFSCSFVHQRRLFTTSVSRKLPSDSLITDLTESQTNGFIFISESTMSLCGLMLGDLVECSSPQLPDKRAVVRTVWPVPDRFGTTVFVTEEGTFTYIDYGIKDRIELGLILIQRCNTPGMD